MQHRNSKNDECIESCDIDIKKKTNVFKFATPALQKWYKNLILRRIENIRFSNLGITIRLKSRYEELSFLDRQKSKYLLDTRPGRNLTATTPSMTLQLLLLRSHQNRNKQSTFPAQKKNIAISTHRKSLDARTKYHGRGAFPQNTSSIAFRIKSI